MSYLQSKFMLYSTAKYLPLVAGRLDLLLLPDNHNTQPGSEHRGPVRGSGNDSEDDRDDYGDNPAQFKHLPQGDLTAYYRFLNELGEQSNYTALILSNTVSVSSQLSLSKTVSFKLLSS